MTLPVSKKSRILKFLKSNQSRKEKPNNQLLDISFSNCDNLSDNFSNDDLSAVIKDEINEFE